MFGISGATIKIVAGLLIVIIIAVSLYIYRGDIKQAAFDQFYAQEVSQQSKIKDDMIKNLQQSLADQTKQIQDDQTKKDVINKGHADISNTISNDKTPDSPVDPVIQNTIDSLRKLHGGVPNALH
jgi:uncharacterized membrane protein YraQ (UPF0718 family)